MILFLIVTLPGSIIIYFKDFADKQTDLDERVVSFSGMKEHPEHNDCDEIIKEEKKTR